MLRKNTSCYCKITIYISFILFKSNRVRFEKYKSEISFVSQITKQTVYSVFHNLKTIF